MFKDIPKPDVVCPECGHTEAFFHCACHDSRGVFTWGTLVTCLRCKTPYSVTATKEVDAKKERVQMNNQEIIVDIWMDTTGKHKLLRFTRHNCPDNILLYVPEPDDPDLSFYFYKISTGEVWQVPPPRFEPSIGQLFASLEDERRITTIELMERKKKNENTNQGFERIFQEIQLNAHCYFCPQ